MVARRRKWNWRVFIRPGLGDFNDKNPLKVLRSVPVLVNRGGEEYLGSRFIPGGGGTSMMKALIKG